jgi:hypothetical protein
MNRSAKDDRSTLSAIARRAMIERGMEPDFSPAVRREVASLRGPAAAEDGCATSASSSGPPSTTTTPATSTS